MCLYVLLHFSVHNLLSVQLGEFHRYAFLKMWILECLEYPNILIAILCWCPVNIIVSIPFNNHANYALLSQVIATKMQKDRKITNFVIAHTLILTPLNTNNKESRYLQNRKKRATDNYFPNSLPVKQFPKTSHHVSLSCWLYIYKIYVPQTTLAMKFYFT